jgi:hypothetical protein
LIIDTGSPHAAYLLLADTLTGVMTESAAEAAQGFNKQSATTALRTHPVFILLCMFCLLVFFCL